MKHLFKKSINALVGLAIVIQPISAAWSAPLYRIPIKLAADSPLQLEISPNPVDFQSVAVSQTGLRQIKLHNRGQSTVQVSKITATTPFDVDKSSCSTLSPEESCEIQASFSPRQEGPQTGELRVTDSFGREVTAPLLGNASGFLTEAVISDMNWNFGYWGLGRESDTRTATLTNQGESPLSVSQLYLNAGSESEFNMVTTCGVALEANQSCEVSVFFSPDTLGERLGAFRIQTADGRQRDVWMLGFGDEQANDSSLISNPNQHYFGEILRNETRSQSFTITNQGAHEADISQVFTVDPDQFITSSQCGSTLVGGDSCDVSVRVSPSKRGYLSSSLQVSASSGHRLLTVPLSVRVIEGIIDSSDSSLTFANIPAGEQSARQLHLTNVGDAPLSLYQIQVNSSRVLDKFSQTNSCPPELAPSASCEVEVVYEPAALSEESSEAGSTSLSVQSSDLEEPTLLIPIHATSIRGSLKFTPSSHDFGALVKGEQSSKLFELSNEGMGSIALTTISAEGFEVGHDCPTEMLRNTACVVEVTFAPKGDMQLNSKLIASTNIEMGLNQNYQATADLFGEGVTLEEALVQTPEPLNFEKVIVDTFIEKSVLLTNKSTKPIRMQPASFTLNEKNAFQLENSTCSSQLEPEDSCSLKFSVTSPVIGKVDGAYSIPLQNGESTAVINLHALIVLSAPDAELEAIPRSLNMGRASIEEPSTKTLTIRNKGPDSVTLNRISSEEPSKFTVPNTCAGVRLEAAQTCEVDVTFPGLSEGIVSSSIRVVSDILQPLMVPVYGKGPMPIIEVEPESLDFEIVDVTRTKTLPLTVRNAGNGSLAMRAALSANAEYSFSSGCPEKLLPGASCNLSVTFAPLSLGVINETLNLNSNDELRPSVAVALTGQSVVGTILATPEEVIFGQLPIGERSSQSVLLTNIGEGRIDVRQTRILQNATGSFSQLSGCQESLAPGQSCSVSIRFDSLQAGKSSANLQVVTNYGEPLLIPITGDGPPALGAIVPSELTFEAFPVGSSSEVQSVSVLNIGEAPLAIHQIVFEQGGARSFGRSHNCPEVLAIGTYCEINVNFTPSVVGDNLATLTVYSANSTGPLSVSIQGRGLSTRAEAVPAFINFGTVMQDSTVNRSFELINRGEIPLIVQGIGLENPTHYSQANSCGEPIAPGEACVVSVTATPKAAGSLNSGVVIIGSHGELTVPLTMMSEGLRISSVAPEYVTIAGGTVVDIKGSGFTTDAVVFIDGVEFLPIRYSSQHMQVKTLAHAAGSVHVQVATNSGANSQTRENALTFMGPPTILSATPDAGSVAGGWTSKIEGSNFHPGMSMSVDSRAVQHISVVDSATAHITVPPRLSNRAGRVTAGVVAAGGAVNRANLLMYETPLMVEWVDAPAIVLDDLSLGEAANQVFLLKNNGDYPATVSSISTINVGLARLQLDSSQNRCTSGLKLMPGSTCAAVVRVTAAALGEVSGVVRANLTIPSAQVPLDVTYFVKPASFTLSASPSTISPASGAFTGLTALPELEATRTVYLLNNVKSEESVLSDARLTLSGQEAHQFEIVEVFKVSARGVREPINAIIAPSGREVTNIEVDPGDGDKPHLGITFKFKPSEPGNYNAQLNITYNEGSLTTLPVYGESLWQAHVYLARNTNITSPTLPEGNFNNVGFSKENSSVRVLTNYLVAHPQFGMPINISSIRIEGEDKNDFFVQNFTNHALKDPGVLPSNDVTPTDYNITGNGFISLGFKPSRRGLHSAELVVEHNGLNEEPLRLQLTGAGVNNSQLVAYESTKSPVSSFGTITEEAIRYKTVNLRNIGTIGGAYYNQAQIEGDSAFSFRQFNLNHTSGRKGPVTAVPEGARFIDLALQGGDKAVSTENPDLQLDLLFNPMTRGEHNAEVTVWHDALGDFTTFSVTGVAQPPRAGFGLANNVRYSEANLPFDTAAFQFIGSPHTQTTYNSIYVRNESGTGKIGVTRVVIEGEDASAFTLQSYADSAESFQGGQDVAITDLKQSSATQPLALNLAFTPIKYGAHSAQLVVYSDGLNGDTQPLRLPLTARGFWDVAMPDSISAVNVPTIAQGANSSTVDITIPTTGTVGVATVTGVKIEGDSSLRIAQVGQRVSSGTWSGPATVITSNEQTVNIQTQPTVTEPKLGLRLTLDSVIGGTFSAKVTIFHDANASGFTEFDVTGSVVSPLNVTLNSSKYLVTNPLTVPRTNTTVIPSQTYGKPFSTIGVYAHTYGTAGSVTFQSAELVNSEGEPTEHFRIVSLSTHGTVNSGNKPYYCLYGHLETSVFGPGTPFSGVINKTLAPVTTSTCTPNENRPISTSSNYLHKVRQDAMLFSVLFEPQSKGEHTAILRVHHNANELGYSEHIIKATAISAAHLKEELDVNLGPIAFNSAPVSLEAIVPITGSQGFVKYTGYDILDVDSSGIFSLSSLTAGQTTLTIAEGEMSKRFLISGGNLASSTPPYGKPSISFNTFINTQIEGTASTRIRIYHDGNSQGYSDVTIRAKVVEQATMPDEITLDITGRYGMGYSSFGATVNPIGNSGYITYHRLGSISYPRETNWFITEVEAGTVNRRQYADYKQVERTLDTVGGNLDPTVLPARKPGVRIVVTNRDSYQYSGKYSVLVYHDGNEQGFTQINFNITYVK